LGLLQLCGTVPEASRRLTVMEAVATMMAHKSGALAVMEGRSIVGVFTERDLMQRVVAHRLDPETTRIEKVMTAPVITLHESASPVAAAKIMRERHIRHLAIVDGEGNYKGLVALRFVLYDLMNELEAKVGDLYSYVMIEGAGGD
jgi:CBS domain-containing protein